MCDMHLKLPIYKILLHGCIESAKKGFQVSKYGGLHSKRKPMN